MLKSNQIVQKLSWQLRLVLLLLFSSVLNLGQSVTHAQLIPDNTLGIESSVVTPQEARDLIQGGAIRDANLFHSFLEFNVNQGGQVYFASPEGIANILTRVTGSNISRILGTLGVDGSANLFLINPRGIVFGANSRLDVAGSFTATTADSIWLDNYQFSATQPEAPPLLTIKITPGLRYGSNPPSRTINNQGILSVNQGQNLTFFGGTVNQTGSLIAPGGTIQVLGSQVSLLHNASVDVSSEAGGGNVLIGGDFQGKGEIPLAENTYIGSDVTIKADALPSQFPAESGNGGRVIVWGDQAVSFYGTITARGASLASPTASHGGLVEVSGKESLQFAGTVDTSAPNGTVGTLLLDPKDLTIQPDGTLSGQAVSQALTVNDVILQANNDITIDDDILILGVAENSLSLQAGRSLIIAPNRTISLNGGNFSAIINDENALASERDAGVAQFVSNVGSQILSNGGDVTIASGTFAETSEINTVQGNINTGSISGNGGQINLFALGNISTGLLDSRGSSSAGDITISSAGAEVITTNSLVADSQLEAGDISINAVGNLSINGDITSFGATAGGITLTSGGILSTQEANITSGRISNANNNLSSSSPKGVAINAGSVILEGSVVNAITQSDGTGGDVEYNVAEEVILRNSNTGTLAATNSGDSGNFTLNARRLSIIKVPESMVPLPTGIGIEASPFRSATGIGTTTSPLSSGNGGDITINASESIEIIGDQPGAFNPIPDQLANTLLQELENNTGIITSALGDGDSGNVVVNSGRLLIRDGSGITTFPILGKGGDLTVNAREILLQGKATIGTLTLGDDAGDLTISADQLTITHGATLGATTFGVFGSGNAGKLTLSVGRLSIYDGSLVGSSTLGQGNGGTTLIEASDLIEVVGVSADGSARSGITTNAYTPETGDAGSLTITTDRLVVRQGGEIATATVGIGQGGTLAINARTLQLDNGRINTSTAGSGNGGDITIRASEAVEIRGAGFDDLQQQIIIPAFEDTLKLENFQDGIVTATGGEGAAGNVFIETPNFLARDGGLIATSTLAGKEGGDITINTSNILELDNSVLGTGTFTDAPSGNVTLNARQLIARGGAQVLTTTFGSGQAGDLTVNVSDSIELINPNNQGILLSSGLFASSAQTASGNGGDVNINIPTGELNIREGATVSVSAEGEGNAGDVNVDARSIFLDQGSITATSTSGEGGNVNLQVADNLILRNNSQISTRAGTQDGGGGNGGNLSIDSQLIVAISAENSDITANAFEGKGGNINLTAQSIFGLQVTDQLTPKSDISASSQLGIDGTVNLNTPNTDPLKELTELPSALTDPSSQIAAGCAADNSHQFVVTGRGGLPEDPRQALRGQVVWQDFRVAPEPSRQKESLIREIIGRRDGSNNSTNDKSATVPAQGWIFNEQGKVELVGNSSLISRNAWDNQMNCGALPR
ncbi:two-partner secretion domain-containing protein [Lyngbya aestuarii]|uniref:two-partner secretion domain-containing protein n=1 Tax=Lyngbya aestuarii TaxID=118322 RepID=UPI00403E0987